MRNINLYIGDSLATVNGEFTFLMNYKFEVFTSPTAIKNNFSRTVALKGDKVNNRIFGHIYNSDMIVSESTYIDPNKRTPFKLYIDDTLAESGYMQLNDITRDKHGILSYNCTFYGGLGDFFWCLQSNDETGETKKLADLNFRITDERGNTRGKENEMDFDITKEFVYGCWEKQIKTGTTLQDTITFVPMFNGIPSDGFSASKAVVNTKDNGDFTDITMKPLNGFYGVNAGKETDEWAARDLRSYLQRPALKISRLFDAIGYGENNGGYTLIKDKAWFNEQNPYYADTYITLPMLSVPQEEQGTKDITTSILQGQDIMLGGSTQPTAQTRTMAFNSSNGIIFSNGYADVSAMEDRTSTRVNLNATLIFTPFDKEATKGYDELYLNLGYIYNSTGEGSYDDHSTAIFAGITAYDTNGSIIRQGNTMGITNEYRGEIQMGNTLTGNFKRQADGTYKFDTSVPFILNLGAKTDKFKVEINASKAASRFEHPTNGLGIVTKDGTGEEAKDVATWFDGVFEFMLDGGITVMDEKNIRSGAHITKKILLSSDDEKSVLDFVLSYSKKFGLVWIKEKNSKTVRVMTRNTYFSQGKKIDMEKLIDFSQDIKIEPLLFDKRFYLFKELDAEDYYSEKYLSMYGKAYGQKRVNTGFPFNNDTEDTESDNAYTAMPEVSPLSTYNRYYRTSAGNQMPSYMANAANKVIGVSGEYVFDITGKTVNNSVWYSAETGRDWAHRPTVAQADNSNGDDCYGLVFFTGMETPVGEDGRNINFMLTDDVDEMYGLCDERCWLYTESTENVAGEKIAIALKEIPHFSRWQTAERKVTHSLDWGKPVELFVPNYGMADTTCIYSRFWAKFISDQYNVNSRSMWCYVDMRKFIIDRHLLANFFWYGNALWMLNEIQEYDVTKDTTVFCNFIRINDMRNYTEGQESFAGEIRK